MNRKERRAAEKRGQGAGAQRGPGGARTSEIAQLYSLAVRHWQKGEGAEAEALLRKILSAYPRHAASLYMLGVMALQGRQPDIAVEWFGKAIASDDRNAGYHNDMGLALQDLGRLDEAIASYRRSISLEPENSRGHSNLSIALQREGRIAEASAEFATSLVRTAERFDTYADIVAMLRRLNPTIDAAIARVVEAWPRRLSIEEAFGPQGFSAVSGDPLLHCLLISSTVRDMTIERVLTSVRAALLKSAYVENADDENDLKFRCALARQCFINEFVFVISAAEAEDAERLQASLVSALAAKSAVSPRMLAAAASYFALDTIPNAQTLLDRGADWPPAVDELLTQQLREPAEERRLRGVTPQISSIEDVTSLLVRQQYEENPYPRWVLPFTLRASESVDEFFRRQYPMVPMRSIGNTESPEILIAGCGTGRHPIFVAGNFKGARVLAIDLSLASLAYAQRKSHALGVRNITFAHADILNFGSIGRTFDVIDTTGVLHHLADPEEGWRRLLSSLRPNGVMRVGLYSERARRDVTAAAAFCVERGFRSTAEGIRAARAELVEAGFACTRTNDFFSVSECRDLLFHVQEKRYTLAKIGAFLAGHELRFIGFHIRSEVLANYRRRFPDDPAMRDLHRWEIFENEQPDTFGEMYQFWIQRQ